MDQRAFWAALAGGICASAGAGIVMVLGRAAPAPTALVAGPERAAAAEPAAAAPVERLELAVLIEEVRRLREALAERREEVGADGQRSATGPLAQELRELRELVERRPALTPAPELDLGSPGPRRAELFQRPEDPDVELDEVFSKRYRLWSQQRVLDEFGVPDQISSDGGSMHWHYLQGGEDGPSTTFSFCGDHLANVWVSNT